MKYLDFISNPLVCPKYFGAGESVPMVVESLFIDRLQQEALGDRLNQERFVGEINHDFGYTRSGLHLAAAQLKLKSGRYRHDAVPV